MFSRTPSQFQWGTPGFQNKLFRLAQLRTGIGSSYRMVRAQSHVASQTAPERFVPFGTVVWRHMLPFVYWHANVGEPLIGRSTSSEQSNRESIMTINVQCGLPSLLR